MVYLYKRDIRFASLWFTIKNKSLLTEKKPSNYIPYINHMHLKILFEKFHRDFLEIYYKI